MFVEREILADIKKWLGSEKVLLIKGSRQVGKTTVLKHLQKELAEENPTIYFSVDLELGNSLFKEPKLFIKYLESRIVPGKRLYVFLDEFQYLESAGLFVKVVFDRLKEHVQLIVSGASSLEIAKSKEFLTGRKIEFHMMPFSFPEYFSGIAGLDTGHAFGTPMLEEWDRLRDFYLIHRDRLTSGMIDYLNWGGYPEPIFETEDRKSEILREIVSTYLQKDIAGFLNIGKLDSYNNLLNLLASQVGNLVNKNEIANTLRINLETVGKYLNVLEGTFVFFLIAPYFTNPRKEMSKMKKVYISDSGLRRLVLRTPLHHSEDTFTGSDIENLVFIHARGKKGVDAINYYRTVAKSEIDFILHKEGRMIPVEVKFRKNASNIPVEIKNFQSRYPERVNQAIIVTRDFLHREDGVYFIPYSLFPFVQF